MSPRLLFPFAKSPPSPRRVAFVKVWDLTATQIAMNLCFHSPNAYASQLAWHKSHCGQFTLERDIHLPADFPAGSLHWCIQTLLFKNDYNFVTNFSSLYFSTAGWCLLWLTSHCIIYTAHASSWQNSQLREKKSSTDVCHNLLCTLHLASTIRAFPSLT